MFNINLYPKYSKTTPQENLVSMSFFLSRFLNQTPPSAVNFFSINVDGFVESGILIKVVSKGIDLEEVSVFLMI